MSKVAIIGGGISGLTAAYYLSKAVNSPLQKIVLVEGGSQWGGWMQSSRFDDGTVFEHGPRSIRGARNKSGYASLLLAEEIGLESKILPVNKDHPASKYRYLWAKNQLCPLPAGPGDILKTRAPFSKPLVAFGWKEPFRKSIKKDDESIHDFFTRRFGEEVATYAISAMFRGIYAGDTRKLSIKSCFGDIFDWEQKYGSIILGALRAKKEKTPIPESALVERFRKEGWSLWSFEGGLQTFAESLAEHVQKQGVELHLQALCSDITFTPDNKVKLKFKNSEETFDHIISAISASDLAGLVFHQHGQLADYLKKIYLASVGVVNLQYEGDVLPLKGLGHLVPFSETSNSLGMLYDSSTIYGHGTKDRPTTRISIMMGGAWFDELFGPVHKCTPDSLAEIALRDIRDQMGIKDTPFRVISRIAKHSIPQYNVGHSCVVDNIFTYIESRGLPLTVLGASYKGVSLNDCILNARTSAEVLARKLAK